MNKPTVSILIPCYNAERHIREAVESCLNQDYENIEVIVVSDGSTDNSIDILRSFKDKRLKTLQQRNQGASAARNNAYSCAKGKYIQFLDSDDLLSESKISSQVEMLEKEKTGIVAISGTVYFQDHENPESGRLADQWPHVDSDNPIAWLIELLGPESGSMVQTGAWLTPRSITDKIGPWDLSICPTPIDDGEYFSRVVLASCGIRKSANGVNFYRQYRSHKGLSAQCSSAFAWGHFRSLKKMETNLYAFTDDIRAKKAFARLYKDLAFRSYPTCPDVAKAALQQAKNLGYGDFSPVFPTKLGRFLCAFLGWKPAKKLNYIYHKIKETFERK